ncbi:phage terminase large subunit family protein [Mesorhizobium sp. W016]
MATTIAIRIMCSLKSWVSFALMSGGINGHTLLEHACMTRHVTFMTIDDVEHYSPDERAAIIAAYPEHEREARAKGIPVLGSGRIFPIAEELIACEPFRLPRYWPRIGALDFGWDHPSAAVELAWDTEADVVYISKAARASQQTPAMQVLALKPWGEWLPWAWPRDGRRETLEGAGTALARQYSAHGLNMLSGHARFADGSVSVEAGLMEMLDRMQSGRFKVFSSLLPWFEEFRLYHRKDGKVVKLRDDLMAATRYRKLTLAYVSGAGTLPTAANGIWLMFDRAGDRGADGTGVGDFLGPASSATDNIVTFAGTTGKVGKDSGIAVSSLAPKASPTFTGTPTGPTAAPGTNTTQLATTGFVKAGFDLKLDSRPNLGVVAQTITDWNNALDNGWYMASAAANAPDGANWFLGFVEAHGSTGYRTQTVHDFVNDTTAADQKLWRRRQAGGAWGGWIKLQWSQAEQDARYVQSSTALLQKFYESAQQTITSGGSLTLAHGLGVKPKNYLAFLQCTTAEGGYSIGDEEPVSIGSHEASTNRGLSVVPDATNMVVRFGSQASSAVQITRKDTGGFLNITNASWRLVIRAWA